MTHGVRNGLGQAQNEPGLNWIMASQHVIYCQGGDLICLSSFAKDIFSILISFISITLKVNI